MIFRGKKYGVSRPVRIGALYDKNDVKYFSRSVGIVYSNEAEYLNFKEALRICLFFFSRLVNSGK